MDEFKDAILLQRRRKKMTKKKVCEIAHISVQSLSNIENGMNTSIDTLKAILDALGLKIKIEDK